MPPHSRGGLGTEHWRPDMAYDTANTYETIELFGLTEKDAQLPIPEDHGPVAFAPAGIASAELRTKDAGDLAAILPGLSGGRRNALFSPRLEPGDTRFLLSSRLSASRQVPVLRTRIGSVQPEASCAASDLRLVRRGPLETHPSRRQRSSASGAPDRRSASFACSRASNGRGAITPGPSWISLLSIW